MRLSCGCYGGTDDQCDCIEHTYPDPWDVAGEDVNLERLTETRLYRQSKFRVRVLDRLRD